MKIIIVLLAIIALSLIIQIIMNAISSKNGMNCGYRKQLTSTTNNEEEIQCVNYLNK